MNEFVSRYGPWALVTGASSGIGSEFADQLAGRGMNLVLVGRRKALLEENAHGLEQRHGTAIRVLPIDLATADAVTQIDEATGDLKIGLLVNNAGGGLPGAFLDHDVGSEMQFVQLNSVTPMGLAHVFASRMAPHGKGGIIFVASTMGYVGTPYAANYAATKAYIIALGEALHYELARQGIDVLVVSPGPTRTSAVDALHNVDFDRVPLNWMEPEEVVAMGLHALGKQSSVIPGEVNTLVSFLVQHVLPRDLATSFLGSLLERMIDHSEQPPRKGGEESDTGGGMGR
ncbi:MAG TPA: SDR family oxidoreductase [Aggregatilineales bacterium]|nr:SDR family oxidoreductase [Aggregatilineales bacterium]